MRVADRSFISAIGAAIIFALTWSASWSLPLRAETADVQQSFAMDLVAAARQQRAVLAIYDPSYRQLNYPMFLGTSASVPTSLFALTGNWVLICSHSCINRGLVRVTEISITGGCVS